MANLALELESLLTLLASLYNEYKALLSFVGGAIAFGVPHAYKIYKAYGERQELKGRICSELIDGAHANRTCVQNAGYVIAEMRLKAQSGYFYGRAGPSVHLVLMKADVEVIQPAVLKADEFYKLVSGAESLSLKKLRGCVVRSKKMKHESEMAIATLEANLRAVGVQAKLIK